MELKEAVASISAIKSQLARTQLFRGYRAAPVALTGAVAIVAGLVQPLSVAAPRQAVIAYAVFWAGVAALNLAICLAGMLIRYRLHPTALSRTSTLVALERLAPCIIVGAIVTIVVVGSAPEHGALLPGLWQLLLALGIFASTPQLPAPTVFVGFFYLLSGTLCLSRADGPDAFSPWMMGLPFSVGQFTAALILYWTLELDDVE